MAKVALPSALLCAATNLAAECLALHPFSSKLIPVKEQQGQTYEAYALASWLPYGPPTIYYGKRFDALAPLMQDFVKLHECAHLSVPTVDEIAANCHALKQMRSNGLSAQDEAALGSWMVAEGAKGFLYRGSGEEYWQATLACAAKESEK